MRRRRFGATGALTALLVALPALATAAQEPTAPPDTVEQLRDATEQRRVAAVTLADLERRVKAAEQALDRLDRELGERTNELADLEAELERARAVEHDAAERTLEASLALDAAHRELEGAVDRWHQQRDELAHRVAETYKHGGNADAVVAAYLGATDLHDIATVQRALRVSLAGQRDLVGGAAGSARAAADARLVYVEARRTRIAEQRQAASARRAAEQLVHRQQQLLGEIEDRRAEQTDIVASFAQDQRFQQALLRELDRRIAQLGSQLATELAGDYADGTWQGPPPAWSAGLPPAGRGWGPRIAEAAARNQLDPRLFAALVWTESYFNPASLSHAGAVGLAQLMPGTAAGLGVEPWDPVQNLNGGARYLRIQLDRFGRADLALAAYNAGPNAVDAAGGIPPYAETQLYVLRVLGYYDRLVQLGV